MNYWRAYPKISRYYTGNLHTFWIYAFLVIMTPTPTLTIAIIVALVLFGLFLYFLFRKPKEAELKPFPRRWRVILNQKVRFFRELDVEQQTRFKRRVQRFLREVKITGVDTKVSTQDKLLVAASGIIPTFGFKNWNHYPRLVEVLLYKDSFRRGDFATEGEGRDVGGMVGGGYMSGKLLLSKRALRHGFRSFGPDNTGIHEFVHLLDRADGDTDGIPEYFLDNSYLIPWVEMMRSEMEAIERGQSDIDEYATTNRAEFLAVVAEYFFNQPDKFAEEHPKLFALCEHIFEQDLDEDGGIGSVHGEDLLSELAKE